MQFPLDLWRVTMTPFAWVFLLYVGAFLPYAAFRQHRRMSAGSVAVPARQRLYVSALITHATFLVVVWAVCRGLGVTLLWPHTLRPVDIVVGVAGLIVGLVPLLPQFQIDNPLGKERAKLIAPRTAGEHAFFYVICATAGLAEELTYRGLFFTLVAVLTGNWWAAAMISSIAFAAVHLFQGWKSAGIAGLMGLREHIVVGLTGTLFVAMVVHFLHDVVTGTVISMRVRRAELAKTAS